MQPKLAADSMLGGLAKWLRLLGLDTYYLRHGPKKPLPDRILLTRRSNRPHQPRLHGWLEIINLSSNDTKSQLRESVQRLGLNKEDARPLSRCNTCNRLLEKVSKDDVLGRVPEFVFSYHNEFSLCPGCGRVYWPGTHHGRMSAVIDGLWDEAS
ncbi:MAG: Mut7-C RNAse domain-containing protein [Deltaproteobacteria bacterium]|nr:Mut7-C RNAse domain-containing protein [Deltaproteobacteria bacterium]MBW2050851.1 Mut7-C RNAse domain-containing protein [Deltaproteobacteria bacterium]MBW2140171.1 Mut7-C RNAse domain-containing protein [Deltaproteobacteria bacterium]MBW2322306.1 Mut7-C RNAse domain-containing protein [Deltaproteobacteria bacterium]